MSHSKNTTRYLPHLDDTSADMLDVVAASLRAAGITDFRPAPRASMAFLPRQARQQEAA